MLLVIDLLLVSVSFGKRGSTRVWFSHWPVSLTMASPLWRLHLLSDTSFRINSWTQHHCLSKLDRWWQIWSRTCVWFPMLLPALQKLPHTSRHAYSWLISLNDHITVSWMFTHSLHEATERSTSHHAMLTHANIKVGSCSHNFIWEFFFAPKCKEKK